MSGKAWAAPVRAALDDLTGMLQSALGDELVGLYVFGSLAMGDFDLDVSDLDLLAVLGHDLGRDLGRSSFAELDDVHTRWLSRHPQWADRLEVIYISATALASFRGASHPIAAISPGEPFNLKTAEEDWNVNWYVVREHGVTLLGPDPTTVIGPIEPAEIAAQQRKMALEWVPSIGPSSRPGYLAYRVLTACRALCTAETDAVPTKTGAAAWARAAMPEWAELIEQAERVRRLGAAVPSLDVGQTRAFLVHVASRLGPAGGT